MPALFFDLKGKHRCTFQLDAPRTGAWVHGAGRWAAGCHGSPGTRVCTVRAKYYSARPGVGAWPAHLHGRALRSALAGSSQQGGMDAGLHAATAAARPTPPFTTGHAPRMCQLWGLLHQHLPPELLSTSLHLTALLLPPAHKHPPTSLPPCPAGTCVVVKLLRSKYLYADNIDVEFIGLHGRCGPMSFGSTALA